MDTLSTLKDNALAAFDKFFLDIMAKSSGTITVQTAAQISTEMAVGMFTPLYSQVDPLHIGEARSMSIAGHYGKRLLAHGENSLKGFHSSPLDGGRASPQRRTSRASSIVARARSTYFR